MQLQRAYAVPALDTIPSIRVYIIVAAVLCTLLHGKWLRVLTAITAFWKWSDMWYTQVVITVGYQSSQWVEYWVTKGFNWGATVGMCSSWKCFVSLKSAKSTDMCPPPVESVCTSWCYIISTAAISIVLCMHFPILHYEGTEYTNHNSASYTHNGELTIPPWDFMSLFGKLKWSNGMLKYAEVCRKWHLKIHAAHTHQDFPSQE